ncbi:P1 family peptidase, partial [Streptomyces boluensis]
LESGHTVGALVVVNAVGSVTDPRSGTLYGRYFEDQEDQEDQVEEGRRQEHTEPAPAPAPTPETHARAQAQLAEAQAESERRRVGGEPGRTPPPERATGSAPRTAPQRAAGPQSPLNTTLAVVATDATLSRAQAQKLAGTSHDGFARAIRPVHLLHDGDTVFTLVTGEQALPESELEQLAVVNAILAAGADTVTRAIVRAVMAAESVDGPGGVFPAYGELYA